jgi:hypothetical protein
VEPVGIGIWVHDGGPRHSAALPLGPQGGLLPGSLFLVLEAFGFLGLGDLGCDEFEDVPAEAAQLSGPGRRPWGPAGGKSARVTGAAQAPLSRAPASATASPAEAITRSLSSAAIASSRRAQ